MLIIYCCIMNYPKLSGTVSVPLCDSGSGSPVKLQSRSRSGLLSHLEAQLGLKGSLPRWCTNMPGKFMLVLGRRPQFLSMCTSPGGCLSILRAWGLVPLLRTIQEKAEGSSKASYDLLSGVAHCPVCHILFLRSKWQSLAHTRGGGEWSFPFERKVCQRR